MQTSESEVLKQSESDFPQTVNIHIDLFLLLPSIVVSSDAEYEDYGWRTCETKCILVGSSHRVG